MKTDAKPLHGSVPVMTHKIDDKNTYSCVLDKFFFFFHKSKVFLSTGSVE